MTRGRLEVKGGGEGEGSKKKGGRGDGGEGWGAGGKIREEELRLKTFCERCIKAECGNSFRRRVERGDVRGHERKGMTCLRRGERESRIASSRGEARTEG